MVCEHLDGDLTCAECRAKEDEAACESVLRELAAREDDLARGAAEGYPVAGAMLTRLAERFAEAIDDSGTSGLVTFDDRPWANVSERKAPRADAFALLDGVTAHAAAANAELPAAIGRWEVSRIQRVDTCPHDRVRPGPGKEERRGHFVTAVLATLQTPCGMRQVTASTEPQSCGHEEVPS